MAWNLPSLPVAGSIATVANWATKVIDSLRYLKGMDGVPTVQSGLIIDNTDGDEYVLPPLLSTAETNSVLDAEGKIAFDETTHQLKLHNGTAVKAVISEADVDDTPVNGADTVPISSNWAYDFINTLTTQADLPYATASGVWARLPKGTAGQRLSMNSGETAPEWATVSGIAISSGSFTGNSTANRAIPHGLGVTPKIVFVFFTAVATYPAYVGIIQSSGGGVQIDFDGKNTAVTSLDSTNFYVTSGTNINTVQYSWTALG
jgi:hypothetical protein